MADPVDVDQILRTVDAGSALPDAIRDFVHALHDLQQAHEHGAGEIDRAEAALGLAFSPARRCPRSSSSGTQDRAGVPSQMVR